MLVLPKRLVVLDYPQGFVHQLDLERHFRLLPSRHDPLRAVHLHDVLRCQVLDVDERDARQCPEQKQVPCLRLTGIVKLHGGERPQFFLRQVLPFLEVGVHMVLRERVARYLAVVVGGRHDVLQRDGVNPNGGLCQPHLVAEVQAEVTYEVLRQLVHGNVAAPVLHLDEVCHVLPYGEVLVIGAHGTVFAHPFGERPVLLVKGTEQRLVLRADALIGVAHHFGGHIRLAVGNPLVVLGYLRLDVVKREVHRLRLLALALGAVALGIPKCPLECSACN